MFPFIGLRQADDGSGTWFWTGDVQITYENWSGGIKPEGIRPSGHCARMNKNSGSWGATACSQKNEVICKKKGEGKKQSCAQI